MLELTTEAKETLDKYFAENEMSPIRIFLAGGCGGPRLALGLDQPGEADDSIEEQGYTFVIEKELLEQAKPLRIDSGAMGIAISSSLQLDQGGGCSSCTSCG